MIDIKQLRYFVSIVDEGSFTRAASVLHIAQSAISYQISQLEEDLGTVLLNRGRSGVTLTQPGRIVFERARTILSELKQIQTDVWSSEAEPTGRVSIAVPPSLARLILPPLLESYLSHFPGVQLVAVEGTRGNMYDKLVQGQIDLALFYDFSSNPEIDSTPLVDDQLCLVGSGELPAFAAGGRVTIESLATCPLMLLTSVYGWRRRLDGAFRERGLEPRVLLELDSLPAMSDLVVRQFGYAVLPQAEVQATRRQGIPVWSVPIDDPLLMLTYELAKLKHRRLSRAGVELELLMRRLVRQLAAEGWGSLRLPDEPDAPNA